MKMILVMLRKQRCEISLYHPWVPSRYQYKCWTLGRDIVRFDITVYGWAVAWFHCDTITWAVERCSLVLLLEPGSWDVKVWAVTKYILISCSMSHMHTKYTALGWYRNIEICKCMFVKCTIETTLRFFQNVEHFHPS